MRKSVSSQFCYELKTTLKKFFLNKKREGTDIQRTLKAQ